jgi:hypothetical protein
VSKHSDDSRSCALRIHSLIKSYASGFMAESEVAAAYQALAAEVYALNASGGTDGGALNALLREHSATNFCLHSAIFSLGGVPRRIAASGDAALIPLISRSLSQGEVSEGYSTRTLDNGLTLHCHRPGGSARVATGVSTSTFFDPALLEALFNETAPLLLLQSRELNDYAAELLRLRDLCGGFGFVELFLFPDIRTMIRHLRRKEATSVLTQLGDWAVNGDQEASAIQLEPDLWIVLRVDSGRMHDDSWAKVNDMNVRCERRVAALSGDDPAARVIALLDSFPAR